MVSYLKKTERLSGAEIERILTGEHPYKTHKTIAALLKQGEEKLGWAWPRALKETVGPLLTCCDDPANRLVETALVAATGPLETGRRRKATQKRQSELFDSVAALMKDAKNDESIDCYFLRMLGLHYGFNKAAMQAPTPENADLRRVSALIAATMVTDQVKAAAPVLRLHEEGEVDIRFMTPLRKVLDNIQDMLPEEDAKLKQYIREKTDAALQNAGFRPFYAKDDAAAPVAQPAAKAKAAPKP